MRNGEYAILKSFAELERTPGVPGLDLPGLDAVSIAKGYGCDAARVTSLDALERAAAGAWSKDVPTVLEVPIAPEIPPLLTAVGDLAGVPVAGILGDQPASLFGHTCFEHGDTKNTYGTGAFLLFTLGTEPVISQHGLITTVAWKLGDAEPVYALEGSVAMAGALVQWLRDNLGLIDDAPEIEQLALSVPDSGGVVFVPRVLRIVRAVLAPRRARRDRGPHAIRHKGHIARAALEAAAYQTATSSRRCSPTPGSRSSTSCVSTAA